MSYCNEVRELHVKMVLKLQYTVSMIVVGPTGSGKSTLTLNLLKNINNAIYIGH